MTTSEDEQELAAMIRWAGLPEPKREHVFHPTRKWRFDFAWPEHRLAVEVEGGIWVQGRHSRGSGLRADMDKYNEAALLGWRVLRVARKHIRTGAVLQLIERGMRNDG